MSAKLSISFDSERKTLCRGASIVLVLTSLLVWNGSYIITLTSLTTLWMIMKYVSRQER